MAQTKPANKKETKLPGKSSLAYDGAQVQDIWRDLNIAPNRKQRSESGTVWEYFYDGVDIDAAYAAKNGFQKAQKGKI